MEEPIENSSPLKSGARAGVLIAAVNIVLTVLMYIINPTLMAIWWMGILILLLNLVLVVVFGINYRNSVGGFLSFKNAYLHGLTTFVVAAFIGMLFNILLYTVIDPGLSEVITEASIDNTMELMQKMGAPADKIDETIEQMEKDIPERFTLTGFFSQFGIGIIFSAILALITGLIVKKSEPI